MIYINDYKKRYYLILVGLIIDYKEQVLITGIKSNIKCLICHIQQKKFDGMIVRTTNQPIYLKSASLIIQWLGNTGEQTYK